MSVCVHVLVVLYRGNGHRFLLVPVLRSPPQTARVNCNPFRVGVGDVDHDHAFSLRGKPGWADDRLLKAEPHLLHKPFLQLNRAVFAVTVAVGIRPHPWLLRQDYVQGGGRETTEGGGCGGEGGRHDRDESQDRRKY